MTLKKRKDGWALQIWSARCPQGYRWRSVGPNDRRMVDMEGIYLVRRAEKPSRRRKR